MVGRTVVVIAHRLSTVRDADSVVVMSAGGVVERGTHDELIAKGGIYKDLVKRQLQGGGGGGGGGDEKGNGSAEEEEEGKASAAGNDVDVNRFMNSLADTH